MRTRMEPEAIRHSGLYPLSNGGVDNLADGQQQHRTVFCTVWIIGTNRDPTTGV